MHSIPRALNAARTFCSARRSICRTRCADTGLPSSRLRASAVSSKVISARSDGFAVRVSANRHATADVVIKPSLPYQGSMIRAQRGG